MKRHRCLSDVPPFFRTRAASYVDSDTAQIIFITFFFLLRRHALFTPFMLECLVRPVLGSHTEWNSNGTCPAMRESEMAVCVPSCEGSSLSSRVALARTDMYVSFLTTPPRDALFRSASCSVSLSDAVAPVASFRRRIRLRFIPGLKTHCAVSWTDAAAHGAQRTRPTVARRPHKTDAQRDPPHSTHILLLLLPPHCHRDAHTRQQFFQRPTGKDAQHGSTCQNRRTPMWLPPTGGFPGFWKPQRRRAT